MKKETKRAVSSGIRDLIIEKLEDAFDVNYEVAQIHIRSMEDFQRHLLTPFLEGADIYYRGERINSKERRLVPTFLRQKDLFSKFCTSPMVNIDCDALFNFYMADKPFISVYKTLYGIPDRDAMYSMLAFAQHYLDISPFIDFSKNLFVSLSFALKGRCEADNDFVIYTAYDIGDDDTTSDREEVNFWLQNYKVDILQENFEENMRKKALPQSLRIRENLQNFEDVLGGMSPKAKLIDIPTNDLMKYQQGVFLLLNNFCLIDSKYLTKAVRQSFVINKYIIDKDLCPELSKLLLKEAPQYRYDCLLDIAQAVRG